jgi:hypothetical protein
MRIVFLLFASILLAACAALSKSSPSRQPAEAFDKKAFCAELAAIPFDQINWSVIADRLTNPNVNSVEKFLCLMNDPKYTSLVTFLTRSRSLQGSDPAAPRAILYGDVNQAPFNPAKERIIFSVNAHKGFRGSGAVEILRYRPGQTIEMIELTFPDGKAHVERGTPSKCQKCHGIEPRPVWDRLAFWPGAFNPGFVIPASPVGDRDKLNAALESAPIFRMLKGAEEFGNGNLTSLLHEINARRVARLIQSTPDYRRYRYAVVGALQGCTSIREFLPPEVQSQHQSRTHLINYDPLLARDLIRKRLAQSPTVTRQTVEAALERAGSPGPIQEIDYVIDLVHREMRDLDYGQLDNSGVESRFFRFSYASGIPQLRYLFEGRGIGIKSWSMDVVEGSYSFSGFGTENILTTLQNEVDTSLPKGETCEKLKALSLAAFRGYAPPQRPNTEPDVRNHYSANQRSCRTCHSDYTAQYTGPSFTRESADYPLTFMYCSNCHSGSDNVGPKIPFNNQAAFDEFMSQEFWTVNMIQYRLSDEAKIRLDHMPPVMDLSQDQRNSILNYIKKF